MKLNKAEPVSFIIFGASGDLVNKKLMPALYNLFVDDLLPNDFKVIGFARSDLSNSQYIQMLRESYAYGDKSDDFFSNVVYFQGDYQDTNSFAKLSNQLMGEPENRLFYMAVPPRLVRPICQNLYDNGVSTNCAKTPDSPYCRCRNAWSRIVFEKPFGVNYRSAKDLDLFLGELFDEEQIFRIDHYLGKNTVQNLMTFRFANNIFEPIWNHHYIDYIEINILEDLTISSRGNYFDKSGLVRDIVQNHALQLLALATMEPPATFSAKHTRDEKAKLLQSITIPTPEEVKSNMLRGQYEGYLDEDGVPKNSETETFCVLKLQIDNWRWAKTPVYIRAGKGLGQKSTDIAVHFKKVPHKLFNKKGIDLDPNVIVFRIQPEEGIHLIFQTKRPRGSQNISPADMNFSYQGHFDEKLPDAYERLLLDVMTNDSTLFIRDDEVDSSWKCIDPIIETWNESNCCPLYKYEVGTDGPVIVNEFAKKEGITWRKFKTK